MIHALPVLPRTPASALGAAETLRDEIEAHLLRAADEAGARVQVLKSPPHAAEVWVRVDAWVPHARDAHLTDRSSAEVRIQPLPFHRFPCEMEVRIEEAGRTRRIGGVIDFDASHATRIVERLARVGGAPRVPAGAFPRCRKHPLQLWRPRNRNVRVRGDWVLRTAFGLLVLGVILLGAMPSATDRWGRRRPSATGPALGGLAILAGVVTGIAALFRRRQILADGKPMHDPRHLILTDSWHTLVTGLGPHEMEANASVSAALGAAAAEGITVGPERIGYLGVDGIVEREQLAARFRRAIGFVQIYRYGDDLYVGWDAHVNAATWIETIAGAGVDRVTGKLCRVTSVRAGWHVPSEYDVSDASCLAEWIHGSVSRVVKRLMADHQIDQEIDFRIVREGRSGIAGRREEKPAGAARRLFRREA